MATATATAASQLERDKQHLEASYGKQIQAAPYPTYVSAAWAKMNPEYGAQAVSGFKTFLNIMDAEVSNDKDWRIEADENAPAYVKRVAEALNTAGSTWDHANRGGWAATDAAFNFANFLIDAKTNDQQLIQAMMALFEEATALGMSPVKASMAVMLANMYPGIRIVFVDAAPKAANNINRFSGNSEQGLTGDQIAERDTAEVTSQTTPDLQKDEPGVVGDFTATPDYAAEVAAQNER